MIRSPFVLRRAGKLPASMEIFQIEQRLLLLSCLLCLLSQLPVCAAVFHPLSAGESYDIANGVSPDGTIVLTARHTWTPSGGFVPFTLPEPSEVWSRDISNNGVVIGLWCGPNTGSCYEAFRTPAGTAMQGLGAFDNWSSDAFAVSSDGSVVVGIASSTAGTQSFRWTEATGLVGLGKLRANLDSHDAAFGVSADGSVIVGQSGDDMILEAFRWTAPTGMVGLGDLPGGSFNSSAKAISSNGQVIVGFATGAQGLEAFRWTESSGIVGLGDLPGGNYSSSAAATTADGSIIVGQAATSLGAEAFIWDAVHGMRNLREFLIAEHGLGAALAGWTLTDALDISESGNVIVGYGSDPSGRGAGWVVVIPEPATALIAVGALLPFIASCPRRPPTAST